MNVTKVLTRAYENAHLLERRKNKPKTNPIKAKTNPIKANFKRKMLYEYAKQTQTNPTCSELVEPISNATLPGSKMDLAMLYRKVKDAKDMTIDAHGGKALVFKRQGLTKAA